jgi:hypothetical protein
MKYETDEKRQPNYLKIIRLKDMKRLKYDLSRKYLMQHGFDAYEINWLVDNKLIKNL